MFETHQPGFCYRSNGEPRNMQQIPATSASINFKFNNLNIVNPDFPYVINYFQHIHCLIFTDGEVDVEKILCLHLLSAHRAETLTPPKRKKYMCKEHSPTERLVERSKNGFNNYETLSHLFPLYTLELLSEHKAMGEVAAPLINDGRLAARILINDKVRELLSTVVRALEECNQLKMKQLVTLAKDTSALKKMMGKKSVSEFFNTLFDHSLINSCEAYVLTPPFRIKTRDLDIKTPSGNIESLIKHPPERIGAASSTTTRPQITNRADKNQRTKTASSLSKTSLAKLEKEARLEKQARIEKQERRKLAIPHKRSVEEEEKLMVPRVRINFIARNIKAAAKTKRIEYDTDEPELWPPRKMSGSFYMPKRRSPEPQMWTQNFMSTVAEEERPDKNETITTFDRKFALTHLIIQRSRKEPVYYSAYASLGALAGSFSGALKKRSTESGIFQQCSLFNHFNQHQLTPISSIMSDTISPKRKHDALRDSKYHLRHTTCPACLEKWKAPLPSPKTPRVKRSAVLPGDDLLLETNLQKRISTLISEEMFRLESYDRKYSRDREPPRKFIMKPKDAERDPLDNVNLDPMDLALIEQEIKRK
ncbi:hypothetical protein NQ318_003362 [Aromia moschata]|uniref:Uncharacterized protein n=1 Tax=Aromia moschata TaxID=1265417 RepID=A0AAV8YB12_9CUCU|nr:hypothetical protein NQ318_003362 [Aromia moschata]